MTAALQSLQAKTTNPSIRDEAIDSMLRLSAVLHRNTMSGENDLTPRGLKQRRVAAEMDDTHRHMPAGARAGRREDLDPVAYFIAHVVRVVRRYVDEDEVRQGIGAEFRRAKPGASAAHVVNLVFIRARR